MHRSSKRIVAPLFLLLVAAVIFVPEVRGDELLNFTVHGIDTLTFTLPQNPIPDIAGTDSFEFIQVPVFASFMPPNTPLDYRLVFSRQADSTNFLAGCDPLRTSGFNSPINPPFFNCEIFVNATTVVPSVTAMWSGPPNNPTFIPGVYGALTISEAPEPSTLALLLMTFATLFLLAVGVRPSHR